MSQLEDKFLDSSRYLMSVAKKAASAVIVLGVIAVGAYWLLSNGALATNRDGERGLGSPNVRTAVTLTVVGGSAFITGFGFRDVIGRAVSARQRNRLKSAQQQVRRQ